MKLTGKKSRGEIYNMGCSFEIEALFIKNWREIKQLLYANRFVKVIKLKVGLNYE